MASSESKTLRRLRHITAVHLGSKHEVRQEGNLYTVWTEGEVVEKYTQVGKNAAARLRNLIREGK